MDTNPDGEAESIGREPDLRKTHTASEFLELFDPVRHALYGYARRAAYRTDHAADIVQEVALKAWREFRRFERGSNFRAWIFKIMVNTVINDNRRAGRERTLSDATEDADGFTVMQRESAWVSLLEDPRRWLEQLDDRLVDALAALAVNERQCLLLRLVEGFTYQEMAAMLEMPLGTIMSHVHRARMRLREQLAGLAVEQGILKEGRS